MEANHCFKCNVVYRLLKYEHLTYLCHEDTVPHTTTTSSSIDARDVVRPMFTPSLLLKIVSFFPASTLYSSASDDSLPARHHEDGWPLPSRCAPKAFHDYRPSGCYGPRPSSYSTSRYCSCQLRSHTLIGMFYRETACRAARHLSIACGSCTI